MGSTSEDSILRDVAAGLLRVHRRPKGRAFLVTRTNFDAYLAALEHEPTTPRQPKKATTALRRRLRSIAGGKDVR
jgi:hypothetical protein